MHMERCESNITIDTQHLGGENEAAPSPELKVNINNQNQEPSVSGAP